MMASAMEKMAASYLYIIAHKFQTNCCLQIKQMTFSQMQYYKPFSFVQKEKTAIDYNT